jgi:transketolase
MRQEALDAIYALAREDDRIVYIGSDLGAGVLDAMKAEMPERFFMEGVSEQHLVGMAAGLALEGYRPYFNTIATFITRRCYEQIAIDVALHDLPVCLVANGGGVVYAPQGPTHMAIDDIALMRALPNMTVIAPADGPEMQRAVAATGAWPHPMYLRIGRGGEPVVSDPAIPFVIGEAIVMRPGGTVAIVATGVMTARALDAAALLEAEGIDAAVVHVHTVKPLDTKTILGFAATCGLLVTLEEHSRIGGLGSAVAETICDSEMAVPLLRLALPDAFISTYGSQSNVLDGAGLDAASVAKSAGARIRAALVRS